MCGTTGIFFPFLGYEVVVQTKVFPRMLVGIEFFGKNFFPMVPDPAIEGGADQVAFLRSGHLVRRRSFSR